jgi:hypothetical protein
MTQEKFKKVDLRPLDQRFTGQNWNRFHPVFREFEELGATVTVNEPGPENITKISPSYPSEFGETFFVVALDESREGPSLTTVKYGNGYSGCSYECQLEDGQPILTSIKDGLHGIEGAYRTLEEDGSACVVVPPNNLPVHVPAFVYSVRAYTPNHALSFIVSDLKGMPIFDSAQG